MNTRTTIVCTAVILSSLLPPQVEAIDVQIPQQPPPIMFDRDAKVTGNPPTVVRTGDMLMFSIVQDELLLKKQNDEVAARLLDAANEASRLAGDTGDTLLIAEARLGLTDVQLRNLRRTYCDSAAAFLAAGTGRADLAQQNRQVCVAGGMPMADVLPTFTTIAAPYGITLKCRDAAALDIPATPQGVVGGRFAFNVVPRQSCGDLQYELRQLQPLAAAAAAWAQANPVPAPLLSDLPRPGTYQENEKSVAAGLLATHADLQTCLAEKANAVPAGAQREAEITRCTAKTTPAEASQLLQNATLDLTQSTDRLLDILKSVGRQPESLAWVAKWLWFTGGRPTYHPLLADPGGSDAKALSAATKQIAQLDAQLAILDKLAPAAKLDTAAALQQSVEDLGKIRAQRDAAAAAVARLTQTVADDASSGERDTLLYRGELFITGPNQPLVAMRHHDAKADFVALNTVTEIAEDERLAVLVENADPSLQINLLQTITAITNDRGKFVDELMKSAGQNDPGVQSLMKDAVGFATAYRILSAVMTLADEELVTPASLIPLPKDQTPALVTNVVPHDVPGPAPANVTYKIRKHEGSEDKEVGAGSYRLNHLYRARFRTGLIYSTLDQATVSGDNKTTRGRHGADATFGVQIYFFRRDIRTISWSHPAFSFYSGLTARDVTKNLLIGLGWEPIGGATLTAGLHIGRSDRTDPDDPQHPVVEQWRRKPFIAITFDVDFLKQLLTLKPSL